MTECMRCALFNHCSDAPAKDKCGGYITLKRIRENKGESCMWCKYFSCDTYECLIHACVGTVSIYYCCDKFERK